VAETLFLFVFVVVVMCSSILNGFKDEEEGEGKEEEEEEKEEKDEGDRTLIDLGCSGVKFITLSLLHSWVNKKEEAKEK
jgi:hypothetical protein